MVEAPSMAAPAALATDEHTVASTSPRHIPRTCGDHDCRRRVACVGFARISLCSVDCAFVVGRLRRSGTPARLLSAAPKHLGRA
jgi:hypothetical protein